MPLAHKFLQPAGAGYMIASVNGIVQVVGDGELIIDVGGVGLRIAIPQAAADPPYKIGASCFLHTYLAVREDALNLYGFRSSEQRSFFELLLDVSGIGPKLSLSILSTLSPEMIRDAVASNQPDVFATVLGVGKKTGERIVFHLKDKLGTPSEAFITKSSGDVEVVSVLTALGYNQVEAQAAIRFIPDDASDDVEERVKLALKYFSKP